MMNLKVRPLLDLGFQPLAVALRDFATDVKRAGGQRVSISVERDAERIETTSLDVFPGGVDDARNFRIAERVVKTLLWVYGGAKIVVTGSKAIFEHIRDAYREGGARAFDADFMATVFDRPFEVAFSREAPASRWAARPVGRHLDGCRIGFDAGGSDRKVSAVVDGEARFSEEVVWHPKLSADPAYQRAGILESLRTAASKMPRVDAIGVSTAGVTIDNRMMISSLFLKVPRELHEEHVRNVYIDCAREIGQDIPVEVANDGDVTALAGAMELNDGCVLGIAMGTSEAGGYVDGAGNITGWLNELAFVPIDLNPGAMEDEWSLDRGCGVKYFSQDAVIKLAPQAGIELDPAPTPAEKLKIVQKLMAEGDPRARAIYETLGIYFGYAIAYYALFYDIRHVLVMGRVTSGEGGVLLLDKAREVLKLDFPELAEKIALAIPDEHSRRVGQSVAAASLAQAASLAASRNE
ncbi:MAG: ROK family protein [Clostridiales bacterium]|nr:ROK family protein [Clostridiales bacterium]